MKNDREGRDPSSHGAYRFELKDAANVVGWPSPKARDARAVNTPEKLDEKRRHGNGCAELQDTALPSGWPSPRSGAATGAHERTETGQDLQTTAGWVTPQARDVKGKTQNFCRSDKPKDDALPDQVTLAGWRSPVAEDAERGKGSKKESLQSQVAGWKTPTVIDGRRGTDQPREGQTGVPLTQQASGTTPTGTGAEMGNTDGYLLNPFFSAYLQGYPREWTFAGLKAVSRSRKGCPDGLPSSAATETPSTQSSPPSSSAATSNLKEAKVIDTPEGEE